MMIFLRKTMLLVVGILALSVSTTKSFVTTTPQSSLQKITTTVPRQVGINRAVQEVRSLCMTLRASDNKNEDNIIETTNDNTSSKILETPTSSSSFSSSLPPQTKTTTALNAHTPVFDDQKPPSPKSTPPNVLSCLPQLISMTRPANNPAIVLLHTLGIYLTLQAAHQSNLFIPIALQEPTMWITLLALLLTSATSMLVNDYYDFKLGNDGNKKTAYLVSEEVPLPVAKTYVTYLYAAALLATCLVPGDMTRITVIMGLMLTFWYTKHLKPKTWLKNVVCASLIALAPLTSGIATLSLMYDTDKIFALLSLFQLTDLWRLVAMLFAGILGREILMDVADVEDDQLHGVQTVPVVFGKEFATTVALVCTMVMASLVWMPTATDLVLSLQGTGIGDPMSPLIRRFAVATIGSLAQLRRVWQVYQTQGQDNDLVSKAVDEGLLTVVLLLASFP